MTEDYNQKIKNIALEIEDLKVKNSDLNYIECTVLVCEKYDIEMESLKKSLPNSIKEKIEADASKLNLLTYRITTL
jgi:hypothetical protein